MVSHLWEDIERDLPADGIGQVEIGKLDAHLGHHRLPYLGTPFASAEVRREAGAPLWRVLGTVALQSGEHGVSTPG